MTQHLHIVIGERDWMTSNQRDHPRAHQQKVKRLRTQVEIMARSMLAAGDLHPETGPVLIVVQAQYRGGRGLDDDNCQPSVKAAKDGLVRAGVMQDDGPRFTHGTYYLPSRRNPALKPGEHALHIQLIDQEVPF